MANIVIANPPLGIYKNPDITIGQAFYMVHLDVNARLRKEILGQKVNFPTYAFNVFGKRGDLLENPVEFAREYKSRPSLRTKLDLCSAETLSDDEPELVESVKRDFLELYNRGYLIGNSSGEYSLDAPKIKTSFSESKFLGNTKMSDRTKEALLRYWNENMSFPHLITKPTRFSVANPIGGQNIGPLFGLANLWNSKYGPSEIVMAGSERNLTNYIFLRGLCQMVLHGSNGMSQIFIYPQLDFQEGINNWDLEGLLKEEYDSDFLRYALLLPSMQTDGTSRLDKSKLLEARKFVYCIGNLGKVLDYSINDNLPEFYFIDDIINFHSDRVLPRLNRSFKDLSNRVRISKLDHSFDKSKPIFSQEYSNLVNMAKIITPKICKKVMRQNGS